MKPILIASLSIITITSLSACTMARQVHLPDGSTGHSISCGGTLNSFASCFNKAGELCGASGYDIVDSQGEVLPFTTANYQSSGSGVVSGNQHGIFGSSSHSAFGSLNKSAFVHRNLFVRCK